MTLIRSGCSRTFFKIAAATVPAFKAGKAFKDAVNVKPAKKAAKKKAKK